jgi:hypothetical protein
VNLSGISPSLLGWTWSDQLYHRQLRVNDFFEAKRLISMSEGWRRTYQVWALWFWLDLQLSFWLWQWLWGISFFGVAFTPKCQHRWEHHYLWCNCTFWVEFLSLGHFPPTKTHPTWDSKSLSLDSFSNHRSRDWIPHRKL